MLYAITLAFPDDVHPGLDEIRDVSTWGNYIAQFTKLAKWGSNKNMIN